MPQICIEHYFLLPVHKENIFCKSGNLFFVNSHVLNIPFSPLTKQNRNTLRGILTLQMCFQGFTSHWSIMVIPVCSLYCKCISDIQLPNNLYMVSDVPLKDSRVWRKVETLSSSQSFNNLQKYKFHPCLTSACFWRLRENKQISQGKGFSYFLGQSSDIATESWPQVSDGLSNGVLFRFYTILNYHFLVRWDGIDLVELFCYKKSME